MAGSMEDIDPSGLTPRERRLVEAARSNTQLAELFDRLAAISRDEDPSCYTADEAEESVHRLGESVKLASLTGWAQSAADSEAAKFASGKGKRSKKKR